MINQRIVSVKKHSDLIKFHKRECWLDLEDETKCVFRRVGHGAGRVYWNVEKILEMNPTTLLFLTGPATKMLSDIDWKVYGMRASMMPSIGKTEIIEAIEKYYESKSV